MNLKYIQNQIDLETLERLEIVGLILIQTKEILNQSLIHHNALINLYFFT